MNMRIALSFASDFFRALLCSCWAAILTVGDDLGPRPEHGVPAAGRHKRALSKDYDYFIALYARVVKFTCHFNNWLPAGAGSVAGERAASDDRGTGRRTRDPRAARRWMVFN